MKLRWSTLFIILFVAIISFTWVIQASEPANEPYGDPRAVRGGQLNLYTSQFPESFNYFISITTSSNEVFSLVYDSLMEMHPITLEYMPLIAKSWEISDDKKVFTIKIDPRAKWADGKPITSFDVKFTYDTIMNPKNLTSVMRLYYCRLNPPEIIDKYTFKFTANTVHFKNLEMIAGFSVLPKHLFEGKDFNKVFNMELPPGSGPYFLTDVKEGRYYTLTRRKTYWADQLPHHRGTYNFDRIKFKVIRDDSIGFEAFKKGEFDIFYEYTAKRWVNDTNSERFQKNWIVKQKIFNYAPLGFQGFAFNMRKPPFNDLRIRQAICYLFDRKTLLDKLMFNQYPPLTSYWPSLYGNSPANFPINYEPEKAKKLLKEVGYTRLDKEGYLINGKGERLEFSLIYSQMSMEKHFTYFAETCKQAGVKVNLELLSGATLMKKADEYKFEMISAAWSSPLFDDPEQLWHSKHAEEIGGSNWPGYKNPEVDRLIDSLPPIFDAAKRNQIIKQIDSIIYRDMPYALEWGANYSRIYYKNVFGMPKTVFSKYSTGDVVSFWWYDPAKEKLYRQAVAQNKPLPEQPEDVYYDKIVEAQAK